MHMAENYVLLHDGYVIADFQDRLQAAHIRNMMAAWHPGLAYDLLAVVVAEVTK